MKTSIKSSTRMKGIYTIFSLKVAMGFLHNNNFHCKIFCIPSPTLHPNIPTPSKKPLKFLNKQEVCRSKSLCVFAHLSQRLKLFLSNFVRCRSRFGIKLFTFPATFPEPLVQFQPNLA